MLRRGKAWTVRDRYGDEVYLTWERWGHILEFHPTMVPFFDELQYTVRAGKRRQDQALPYKHFYVHSFDNLPVDSNVIVAVVLVNVRTGERFVTTAYMHWMESMRK
jgi:hypothetical protein